MTQDKETLRAERLTVPIIEFKAGKAAERLRGDSKYRQAKVVYVAPAAAANQIRINALLDGKDLIMPAPSLKDGFYRLRPFTVPFKDLGISVIYKGLAKYGKRLQFSKIAGLKIDLLINDCLALDQRGVMLGDGKGFFDLASAIFAEHGALNEGFSVYAVAGEECRVAEIKADSWDVRADCLITPAGIVKLAAEEKILPRLQWADLPEKRVKKITPIWDLWQQKLGLE